MQRLINNFSILEKLKLITFRDLPSSELESTEKISHRDFILTPFNNATFDPVFFELVKKLFPYDQYGIVIYHLNPSQITFTLQSSAPMQVDKLTNAFSRTIEEYLRPPKLYLLSLLGRKKSQSMVMTDLVKWPLQPIEEKNSISAVEKQIPITLGKVSTVAKLDENIRTCLSTLTNQLQKRTSSSSLFSMQGVRNKLNTLFKSDAVAINILKELKPYTEQLNDYRNYFAASDLTTILNILQRRYQYVSLPANKDFYQDEIETLENGIPHCEKLLEILNERNEQLNLQSSGAF